MVVFDGGEGTFFLQDATELFKDLLEAIDFARALGLANAFEIEVRKAISEGKVDNLTLSCVVGAVIVDKVELLLGLQEHLVAHDVVESFRRLVLSLVEVDDVWDKLFTIWIVLIGCLRVNLWSLCLPTSLSRGFSALFLSLGSGGCCFLFFLPFALFFLLLKALKFLLIRLLLFFFILRLGLGQLSVVLNTLEV